MATMQTLDLKPLPASRSAWRKRVQQCGITTTASVHSPGVKFESASNIKLEQFLRLHVLWVRNKGHRNFNWSGAGLAEWEDRARKHLRSYGSWIKYLNSLRSNGLMEESTFALVREHQRECTEIDADFMTSNVTVSSPHAFRERKPQQLNMNVTALMNKVHKMNLGDHHTPEGSIAEDESDEELLSPTEDRKSKGKKSESGKPENTPSQDSTTKSSPSQDSPASEWGADDAEHVSEVFPSTEDEQIVNTAVLDLLKALIIQTGLPLRWTLRRLPLKAHFNTENYNARTDGCLRCTKKVPLEKRVRALVEVKPVLRGKKRHQICMQEAAQTVAWLKTYPDAGGRLNKPGRRIHISQDRHQIFILVPEYNSDYVAYLNDPSQDSDAFMTIREYGPFDIREHSHMRELGKILFAIALRAEADLKADKAL
ncbi:uncharacterized protein BDV14DRAFT_198953 [Aspergillus stella-maris]|uniref:uncharacterized protein n=1 Tax=Aspergillus stella-maris TaxID=1810926 RepID=UPI003CCCAC16